MPLVYDVDRIRSQFPALRSGTAFFDGPGGTQVPTSVADAVAGTLTSPIANRGTVTAAARAAEEVIAACRAALADLLGADPRGIVVGRSATALAFDTARALARTWQPGDEVIVTRLDHDANITPWHTAAALVGARVRVADFDPESGELTTEHLAAHLTDRTRLVAFTAASNLLGTRPDVPGLAALAHDAGALVYLDAVHHVPHVRTDLAALGVDLLACSPYKFLGPHCGVLAASPELLASLRPDKLVPSPDDVPERFELGTLPYELMAGVTAAVDFLAGLVPHAGPGLRVSRPERLDASFAALARYEDELIAVAEQGLSEIPGLRLHGHAKVRTPTLLFSVDGADSARMAEALAARGVNAPAGSFYALQASRHLGLGDGGALRAGLAPYSTHEDVERLIRGVREIAPDLRSG